MIKYFNLNNIKQYYKNGSFYICGIGNVYARWNNMIYAIFSWYVRFLIHRRTIIWFFKGIMNRYYWCEFQHYYYMERFISKREFVKDYLTKKKNYGSISRRNNNFYP